MSRWMDELSRSALFRGYDGLALEGLVRDLRHRVSRFTAGQLIAAEGAPAAHVGIVLEGTAEIQKTFASGKVVALSRMEAGDAFGEALVFSTERDYPASIMASCTPTSIMFIPHQQIRDLCQSYPGFFPRFARLLSNRLLMLNKKVHLLTYPTVRQKVIAYLLDRLGSGDDQVLLPVSREAMAQELSMPRPSLSRELAKLQRDGYIAFRGREVRIKDREGMVDRLLS